jgi:hypothetical protein
MANCYNYLRIQGQYDNIRRFKEGLLMDKDGTYHLVPSYVKRYCTKDIHTRLKNINQTEVVFVFESRWMPPMGLDEIATLFPELDFYLEYIQPKEGIEGYVHWVNGVVEGHESNILGPEGAINSKEAD